MASGRTLEERFDPRRNSLSVIRLLLAALVALVHAQALGWGDQPVVGNAQVGDLAVDGFFVLSGFLVTRSAGRLRSVRRFAWHRALRILPGFWACLVVTGFGFAPLIVRLQGRSPWSVLSGPESAGGFVLWNAAVLIRQWDIADVAAGYGEQAANGALWSLFYEVLCYVAIGVLAAVGLIRRSGPGRPARPEGGASGPVGRGAAAVRDRLRPVLPVAVRRHPVALLTALVWLLLTLNVLDVVALGDPLPQRLLLLFLLGGLGHLYADRIRFTPGLVLLAWAALLVALFLMPDHRPVGAVAFAYLFGWLMVALPVRAEPPADLSYGMYVYHWPVAMLLVEADLPAGGRLLFTLAVIGTTAVVALVSWHLIERPAMAYKGAAWVDAVPRFLRRQPQPQPQPQP